MLAVSPNLASAEVSCVPFLGSSQDRCKAEINSASVRLACGSLKYPDKYLSLETCENTYRFSRNVPSYNVVLSKFLEIIHEFNLRKVRYLEQQVPV
jgi:hypothetical protein